MKARTGRGNGLTLALFLATWTFAGTPALFAQARSSLTASARVVEAGPGWAAQSRVETVLASLAGPVRAAPAAVGPVVLTGRRGADAPEIRVGARVEAIGTALPVAGGARAASIIASGPPDLPGADGSGGASAEDGWAAGSAGAPRDVRGTSRTSGERALVRIRVDYISN